MGDSIKQYIKKEIRSSRFRLKRKIETAMFICSMFKNDMDNLFTTWLSYELGFKTHEDFHEYLKFVEKVYTRNSSRARILTSDAESVHSFYKEHSIISVDRQNDRHMVHIKNTKLHELSRTVVETKFGPKLQANRYVYTKSTRKLYNSYLKEHDFVSYASFLRLKPFYIMPPSNREMESCCCIYCLNPHGLYNAIKKSCGKEDKFPDSLTEYLTQNFKCEKDSQNFHKIDCISGACGNQCSTKLNNVRFGDKVVTYTVFEGTPTYYYDKQGKEVCYKRTARCDKKATVDEIHELLQKSAKSYLLHRHFVNADKPFWSKFTAECNYPILYFDFSENINITPKHEAQSAHFSGRQYTLHCSIMETTNAEMKVPESSYITSQMTQHMTTS